LVITMFFFFIINAAMTNIFGTTLNVFETLRKKNYGTIL